MTNVERFNELIKGIIDERMNGDFAEINEDFLKVATDTVSIWDEHPNFYHCTIENMSFCNARGENSFSITLRGMKGNYFGERDEMNVRFNEDLTGYTTANGYSNKFEFESYDKMPKTLGLEIFARKSDLTVEKIETAEKFEKTAKWVEDILDGTSLRIKWYDHDNARLGIEDNEGNYWLTMYGEKYNIRLKSSDHFSWDNLKALMERDGLTGPDNDKGFYIIDLFLWGRMDYDKIKRN